MARKRLAESWIPIAADSWFTRAWTVQELALSQNVEVMCGNHRTPWKSFLACSYLYFLACAQSDLEQPDREKIFLIWQALEARPGARRYFLKQWKCTSRTLHESSIRLLFLCSTITHNDATNPRDKIYSVYQMLKTTRAQLPNVDYSQSTNYVFEAFTRTIVQATSSLWILLLVHRGHEDSSLPSWVPDWAASKESRADPIFDYIESHRALFALPWQSAS
jgi:hypothetical protein